MSDAPPINGVRVITAVLGALVLFSVLSQVLEASLVRAVGGESMTSLDAYFAVLTRPPMLIAKAAINVVVGLLTGYLAGRIAGTREVTFAGIAAAAESCSLAWGFMTGEYVVLPLWTRILLLVTAGPAMVAGAWVRMQARLAMESTPEPPPAAGPTAGPSADRETP
jgi:uncharacterized membrane protein YeaQ/YmgE (transglycosylase-associated protein family)